MVLLVPLWMRVRQTANVQFIASNRSQNGVVGFIGSVFALLHEVVKLLYYNI